MRTLFVAIIVLALSSRVLAIEVVRGVVRETQEVSCAVGCGSYSLEPDPGYQFTALAGDFRLFVGQHVQVTGHLDNCGGCLVLVPSEAVLVLPPTTGVGDAEPTGPRALRLSPNYPNPFNPATTIGYELPAAARVRLSVANLLGQEVALLSDGEEQPGDHRREWSPGALPGGVYFLRLDVSYGIVRRVLTRPMLYLR